MKNAYIIIGAAAVAAYLILRSGTAKAAGSGGVIVGGRVYRPDEGGYLRNDDGGVTRWLT